MSLKKYGTVQIIRASGYDRRTSITGRKVVYDKDDTFNKNYSKTIVFLEKGWSDLTEEDKLAILDKLGIEDYPDKVTWWGRGITIVKDRRTGGFKDYYVNGFAFNEAGIETQREINFAAQKPELKIIKGKQERITREYIDKQNHDDTFWHIMTWVFLAGFIFIIWLLFAPK